MLNSDDFFFKGTKPVITANDKSEATASDTPLFLSYGDHNDQLVHTSPCFT
jgi:hypothetical protein